MEVKMVMHCPGERAKYEIDVYRWPLEAHYFERYEDAVQFIEKMHDSGWVTNWDRD